MKSIKDRDEFNSHVYDSSIAYCFFEHRSSAISSDFSNTLLEEYIWNL
jgi:hypothetical protein